MVILGRDVTVLEMNATKEMPFTSIVLEYTQKSQRWTMHNVSP